MIAGAMADENIVDLVNGTPKIAFNEWVLKVQRLFLLRTVDRTEQSLYFVARRYLKMLHNKLLYCHNNQSLRNEIHKHLFLLNNYYRSIGLSNSQTYFTIMEDIISIFITIELKLLRQMSGDFRGRALRIAKRILHCLVTLLDNYEMHISHVLLKVHFDRKSQSCVYVMNWIYTSLLIFAPIKNPTHNVFCRYYLLFSRWSLFATNPSFNALLILKNKFDVSKFLSGMVEKLKIPADVSPMRSRFFLSLQEDTIETYFEQHFCSREEQPTYNQDMDVDQDSDDDCVIVSVTYADEGDCEAENSSPLMNENNNIFDLICRNENGDWLNGLGKIESKPINKMFQSKTSSGTSNSQTISSDLAGTRLDKDVQCTESTAGETRTHKSLREVDAVGIVEPMPIHSKDVLCENQGTNDSKSAVMKEGDKPDTPVTGVENVASNLENEDISANAMDVSSPTNTNDVISEKEIGVNKEASSNSTDSTSDVVVELETHPKLNGTVEKLTNEKDQRLDNIPKPLKPAAVISVEPNIVNVVEVNLAEHQILNDSCSVNENVQPLHYTSDIKKSAEVPLDKTNTSVDDRSLQQDEFTKHLQPLAASSENDTHHNSNKKNGLSLKSTTDHFQQLRIAGPLQKTAGLEQKKESSQKVDESTARLAGESNNSIDTEASAELSSESNKALSNEIPVELTSASDELCSTESVLASESVDTRPSEKLHAKLPPHSYFVETETMSNGIGLQANEGFNSAVDAATPCKEQTLPSPAKGILVNGDNYNALLTSEGEETTSHNADCQTSEVATDDEDELLIDEGDSEDANGGLDSQRCQSSLSSASELEGSGLVDDIANHFVDIKSKQTLLRGIINKNSILHNSILQDERPTKTKIQFAKFTRPGRSTSLSPIPSGHVSDGPGSTNRPNISYCLDANRTDQRLIEIPSYYLNVHEECLVVGRGSRENLGITIPDYEFFCKDYSCYVERSSNDAEDDEQDDDASQRRPKAKGNIPQLPATASADESQIGSVVENLAVPQLPHACCEPTLMSTGRYEVVASAHLSPSIATSDEETLLHEVDDRIVGAEILLELSNSNAPTNPSTTFDLDSSHSHAPSRRAETSPSPASVLSAPNTLSCHSSFQFPVHPQIPADPPAVAPASQPDHFFAAESQSQPYPTLFSAVVQPDGNIAGDVHLSQQLYSNSSIPTTKHSVISPFPSRLAPSRFQHSIIDILYEKTSDNNCSKNGTPQLTSLISSRPDCDQSRGNATAGNRTQKHAFPSKCAQQQHQKQLMMMMRAQSNDTATETMLPFKKRRMSVSSGGGQLAGSSSSSPTLGEPCCTAATTSEALASVVVAARGAGAPEKRRGRRSVRQRPVQTKTTERQAQQLPILPATTCLVPAGEAAVRIAVDPAIAAASNSVVPTIAAASITVIPVVTAASNTAFPVIAAANNTAFPAANNRGFPVTNKTAFSASNKVDSAIVAEMLAPEQKKKLPVPFNGAGLPPSPTEAPAASQQTCTPSYTAQRMMSIAELMESQPQLVPPVVGVTEHHHLIANGRPFKTAAERKEMPNGVNSPPPASAVASTSLINLMASQQAQNILTPPALPLTPPLATTTTSTVPQRKTQYDHRMAASDQLTAMASIASYMQHSHYLSQSVSPFLPQMAPLMAQQMMALSQQQHLYAQLNSMSAGVGVGVVHPPAAAPTTSTTRRNTRSASQRQTTKPY